MGNNNTRESRPDHPEGPNDGRDRRLESHIARGILADSRFQMGRTDRGFLNMGGSSSRSRENPDAPFEHRETKQEREARRLERERVQRAQERERSIREEHVDGGYLVTMGVYVGTEDFNKAVVRQLQIERKLAPFWRGLQDWSPSWAEHQLIAAARGLPIPAADAPPDPALLPRPPPPDSLPTQNVNSLTVEMGPRTLSTASDRSGSGSGSALPSPSTAGPSKGSIKPRARALAAALSVGSRNASSTDLTPREVNLPHDPFVNGQPLEVYLYKDATECPICFLTYPPYLNHTRCCDQPICSECFVQIKRADPHLPEHHPDGQARDPNQGLTAEDPPEMLISEPSACPYCQQPEFGVTYEPPPFRRGLAFAASNLASNTAMSSQSSLNSTLAPAPATTGRRRAHSLSVNAPNVITTDRIRPDWATKLATARAHQARRAAAATALHTAAFLIGGNESRSRIRTSRFGRRNAGTNSGGTTTPGGAADAAEGQEHNSTGSGRNPDVGRRTRMDELEDMMFMEAVRLSLAAEEERKRKVEKTLQKEAKKREKERDKAERKALKKQGKDPYGGGASGASGSSLSLGLGRKRGNSAASNLRLELTLPGSSSASSKPADTPEQRADGSKSEESKGESGSDKGKGVDRGPQPGATETCSTGSLPIPTSSSRGGSHLRQMSNASSLGSSGGDSPSGSLSGQGPADSDAAKRRSMGGRSDSGDGETESEPMLNFRSLAEIVGVNLDDGSAMQQMEAADGSPRPLSRVPEEEKEEETTTEHVERSLRIETSGVSDESASTATENTSQMAPPFLDTPELTITPGTPTVEDGGAEDKRLGESHVSAHETTQATH
ncbi:hypothetical protein J3F83DRAFT_736070 [Trichoderma novae-zelandiae]